MVALFNVGGVIQLRHLQRGGICRRLVKGGGGEPLHGAGLTCNRPNLSPAVTLAATT